MKKDTIRKYRNTVQLNFVERGENFTLKVPHYNKWVAVIRFLRKRGWKIGENLFYRERYGCLSKYNKIGYKNDMACLMEIGGGFISVQFGNVKNLWKDMPQSFWDNPSDERYAPLTYLELSAINLEIWKLMKFCDKWNVELVQDKELLTAEEYIIDYFRTNNHIHGKVECLNDIKMTMKEDSYNVKYNSTDADGRRIICGETKYYYDWITKRLSYGVVWHHINNMWWVISGGKLRNIAAFELFDYSKQLPGRKPIGMKGIEQLLSKFENKRDYKRCMQIAAFYNLKATCI